MSNDIAVTAPAPTLLAGTNGLIKSAPVPALVATMTWPGDDITLTAALTAPAPSLSATIITSEDGVFAGAAPLPGLVAAASADQVLTFGGLAPAPVLIATLLTGNDASVALSALAPTLAASGWVENTITLALAAPAPRLGGSGAGAALAAVMGAAVTEAYRTWVLNTRKNTLTEYGSEWAFNSYAEFNGQVIAAGASGIVVLGMQGLDNAAAIDARVRTGKEGFGSSFLKRIPRIYTSLEADGDMLFRTITVEGGERTYRLPHNIDGLQQRRVPVGKGPKARHWQLEWENVDGCDFSINDLLIYPVVLRRRVQ